MTDKPEPASQGSESETKVQTSKGSESETKAQTLSLQPPSSPNVKAKEIRIVGRFFDIPLVKSVVANLTSFYKSSRETNFLTKASFGVAELSFWTALQTAKLAYSAVPNTGTVGKLKKDFERTVSLADTLACYGLDVLQSNFPSLLEGTGQQKKLRRSTRRRQKTQPGTPVTFPISPERKRKRSTADSGDEDYIEELLCVNESYNSEEDSDYKPTEGDGESEDDSDTAEEDSGEGEDEEDAVVVVESGGQSLTVEEVGKQGLKLKCNTEWTIVNGDEGKPSEGGEAAEKAEGEANKVTETEVRGEEGSFRVGRTSSPKEKKTSSRVKKAISPKKPDVGKRVDKQHSEGSNKTRSEDGVTAKDHGKKDKVEIAPPKVEMRKETGNEKEADPLKGRIVV